MLLPPHHCYWRSQTAMVGVGSPQEAVGTWIVVMTSLKNKLKRLDYRKVLYLTNAGGIVVSDGAPHWCSSSSSSSSSASSWTVSSVWTVALRCRHACTYNVIEPHSHRVVSKN